MKTTNLNFDCWHDFVNYASNQPETNKESYTGSYEFTGTESFKQALDFAYEGWQDGRDKITEMREKIDNIIGSCSIQPLEVYDNSGAFVDVGRYCEGVPECMIQFQEQEQPDTNGNVITIDVGLSISCLIDIEEIIRRGAAIASLCDSLEATGKRIEINILSGVVEIDQIFIKTTIKQPDQPLDIDCISFALINPSVLRRLTFSIMEQQPNAHQLGIGFGYGSPQTHASRAEINLSEKWLQKKDFPMFLSDEATADWIKEQLENNGIMLESVGA